MSETSYSLSAKFAIPGFGTFNKKHRKARTGRNLQGLRLTPQELSLAQAIVDPRDIDEDVCTSGTLLFPEAPRLGGAVVPCSFAFAERVSSFIALSFR